MIRSMQTPDEKKLSQQLEQMRTHWRLLRRAHEQHSANPDMLGDRATLEELRRTLERSMLSFAQSSLEWVEQGHELIWRATPSDTNAVVLERSALPSPLPLAEGSGAVADEIAARLVEFAASLDFHAAADVLDEMQRLEEWTQEDVLERMERWPDRGRVLTIELIAARARHIQELPSSMLELVDIGRITVIFGRMAEHLKQGWPGRAHGLARAHTPRSFSWRQDAEELQEELSIWRQRSPELR